MFQDIVDNPACVRVTCWNVRGYLASIPYIRYLLTSCDVLAVSEHWVFENRLRCLSDISDTHRCFARSSRFSQAEDYGHGRGQGGVALFWDKKLKGVSIVSDLIMDRACAIRLQTERGGVIYFVSVYLPSQGSSEPLETTLDEITEVVESREVGAHVIILGDFNGDVGCAGGPRGCREATPRGEKVMRFLNRHSMTPVNMQHIATGPVDTYDGLLNGSTLDYVMVPLTVLGDVLSCKVHDQHVLNTSDHRPVSASISIKGISSVPEVTQNKGHLKWGKLSAWDKFVRYQCVLEPLVADINVGFNDSPKGEVDLDRAFDGLIVAIHAVSDTLPHSWYKHNLKPYWNRELSSLKSRKVNLYRALVSANRPRERDNLLYMQYTHDKNLFHKTIKKLAKSYEDAEIRKIVKTAEVSRNSFWKMISTARNSKSSGVSAIKRTDKVVVHEIDQVLMVWAEHFKRIVTPKEATNYDQRHFDFVTDFVARHNDANDLDQFLIEPFTVEEVHKGIKTLHLGKVPGFDNVMTEHLLYAGPMVVYLLCDLYNGICTREYIPLCFKRGIQVPLYKGKDTCVLDPNNYRGITLLSIFNKLFEVLLWQRLKPWWVENRVISELQGACRGGASCIHTAFNLKETVATSMENYDKCFVAFFDVAKAFDTVWIDGLFKQMHDIGIKGKTWRLLYRGYLNFSCCVKLSGKFSEWYEPLCGIHQGFFLSLMKYITFINSLLVERKESNICCKIYKMPSTPVGILVYGESVKDHNRNSINRIFKLGPDRVKERSNYDHVGIRNTIFDSDISGISERISKGRRSFNAQSGIGIRKGGVTIFTCNILFWTIVVPTTIYGCELWILDDAVLTLLEDFQNYIGKKVQRLHPRSPNICSYYGLCWMRLERMVQIRKMMFIRTIMVMGDHDLPKTIFCERAKLYFSNLEAGIENVSRSAVFDLLNTSTVFNMQNEIRNMVERQHFYPKSIWKNMVWKKGWELECVYWRIERQMHKSLDLLSGVSNVTRYNNWWALSDKYPERMRECEIIVKILCHASALRDDDVKYKSQLGTNRMCDMCNEYETEDARHFVLHCSFFNDVRDTMMYEIDQIVNVAGTPLFRQDTDMLFTILWRRNEDLSEQTQEDIWLVILRYVSIMYRKNLKHKSGIG